MHESYQYVINYINEARRQEEERRKADYEAMMRSKEDDMELQDLFKHVKLLKEQNPLNRAIGDKTSEKKIIEQILSSKEGKIFDKNDTIKNIKIICRQNDDDEVNSHERRVSFCEHNESS